MPNPRLKNINPAIAIAEELEKRKKVAKKGGPTRGIPEQLIDRLFDKQRNFVLDPALYKCALTSRRSGKTYACNIYLLYTALTKPNSNNVYLGLIRQVAKDLCFNELKRLISEFSIPCIIYEAELSVKFPNGSQITCKGVNSNTKIVENLRGAAFDLVIIDEAQSFSSELLEYLIKEVIDPALTDRMDQGATLCLTGTPGYSTSHLFFRASKSEDKRTRLPYKRHYWNSLENPHVKDNFEKKIKKLQEENPLIVETPYFRREYKGEWIQDDTKLVYHLDSRDGYNTTQIIPPDKYNYVLGVDLGWNDATAYVLCAYGESSDILYIIDAYKHSKQDLFAVSLKIKAYMDEFNVSKIIIDGANRQSVETMRQRFHLPLTAAEKQGKEDHIEILNSDLARHKIKLLMSPDTEGKGRCHSLVEEMSDLIWEEKDGRRREHPGCENHLCDAFLYAWRYCYHYIFDPTDYEHLKQQRARTEGKDPHFIQLVQKLQNLQNADYQILGETYEFKDDYL